MATEDPAQEGRAPLLDVARDTALAVHARMVRHNLSVQAAGIAFFGFLSLIPAMVAFLSVYGLVADPNDIERQIQDVLEAAPEETRQFVIAQLQSISTSSSGGVTTTFVISLLIALWGASGAVNQLLKTLNQVFELPDQRGGVKVRGLALLLTVGAIIFLSAVGFALTALPQVLDNTEVGDSVVGLVNLLRFPGIAVLMVLALGILYRIGPHRPHARWRPVSVGAVVATVLWVLASIGFSLYVTYFASYNETYGVLAGLVVLQLWFWITALLVLLGGEIDASLELRRKGL